MCKKTIFYSVFSVCVALAFAFTAQAQVSIGVSIQPFPDAGSNPCTDQLVTNQVYNVTVYASNSSFSGSPANQIPVYLEGKVTENDACSAVGCPAGSEIPGAIGVVSCTPADVCITNCQETAPGTGIVTFDVTPGCLLLTAGQQFRPLVSITKQALIPSLAGTLDCTLPSDYGKYNMAAKCIDDIGTGGVDCQVRDPQTGQTGTGSGTSEVYFPPAPCIDVTKNCEPDLGCLGGDITFTGTVTNCGDVDLINLNVADNKGNITGGTCGSILPVGQSCTYSGVYTAPIVIGENTDTVTATGETTQGATVTDQASDTCIKEIIPPSINVVKNCEPPQTVGGNITYTVAVSNTTPLTCDGAPWDKVLNCVATDSNPAVAYNEPLTFTLNPGEVKNFTAAFDCPALTCPATLVEQDTFSVTCTDDLQQQASGSDSATCSCPCETPNISVTKDCEPKSIQVPGPVTVFGTVTNTGDVSLSNVSVTDNTGVTITCPKTTLAIGESMQCSGTVDCPETGGPIPADTFTATGTSPAGATVTDTAGPPAVPCVCTVPQPCVTVNKTCQDSQECNTPISYGLTITNCGVAPLSCVVTDTAEKTQDSTSNPVDIPWTPALQSVIALAPGAANSYTAIYTAESSSSAITVSNTVSVVCTDIFGQTIDAGDSATCSIQPCEQPKACWFTGGGVKFEPILGKRMATAKGNGTNGPDISIGGNVNPGCSPTAGDGGNWNHIDHKAKLHLQNRHIEVVKCGNMHDEGIEPIYDGSTSPKTPFNYIEWKGTGTLKGISGNKVDYGTVYFYARAEDRSEPGSKETLGPALIDRYWIAVYSDAAMTQELYRFGNAITPPPTGNGAPNTICAEDSFACTDTIAITGGNFQLHVSSCDEPPPPGF